MASLTDKITNPKLRTFYENGLKFLAAAVAPSPAWAIKPGSSEWISWADYFRRNDVWPWFMSAALLGEIKSATVPARWPEWFDGAGTMARDGPEEPPPAGAPPDEPLTLSPEEQARRAAFAKAIVADVRTANAAATPGKVEEQHKRLMAEARERTKRREEEKRVRHYEAHGLDPYEHGGLAASPELLKLLAEQAEARR